MFYIKGRSAWGARAPNSVTHSDWRAKRMTVIAHHSADNGPKWKPRVPWRVVEAAWLRSIQKFHMGPQRGWSDIAYNYLIMPSGNVYEGRGFQRVGAHAPNWNTKGIGICFAGNYVTKPPTKRAVAAYHNLVDKLVDDYKANIVDEKPHCDVTATSCGSGALRRALGL